MTANGDKRVVHGFARRGPKSRAYKVWEQMKNRCNCSTNPRYRLYGARGIKVCERWLSFSNFLADMGHPPAKLSIDRIDNDGNYQPDNCRWATQKEQCRNRSGNKLFTHNGITQVQLDWATQLGISYTAIRQRLLRGWSIAEALTTGKRCRRPSRSYKTAPKGLAAAGMRCSDHLARLRRRK